MWTIRRVRIWTTLRGDRGGANPAKTDSRKSPSVGLPGGAHVLRVVMPAPGRLTTWYPAPIGAPVVTVAAPQPKDDPFYSYTGAKPRGSIPPGTVLKTRSFSYHILGFPTLLET